MKTAVYFALIFALGSLLLSGCSLAKKETGVTGESGNFERITADEAKDLMDSEESYVILDVRTKEEYDAGHIEGAILIPEYEIATKAESVLTDKDELILVYCRSGRRSQNAASSLAALGYTNVKDFGGINSWKYGTVTE